MALRQFGRIEQLGPAQGARADARSGDWLGGLEFVFSMLPADRKLNNGPCCNQQATEVSHRAEVFKSAGDENDEG